jgi:hypothetical protein
MSSATASAAAAVALAAVAEAALAPEAAADADALEAAPADDEAGGEAGGAMSEDAGGEEGAHGDADVGVAGAGAGAAAGAVVAAAGGAVVGLWAAAAQVGDAGGEAIADMEGRRREIKREQDLLSRELFNEQRERARLLARAQGLSDSDLLSIVGARAAAKAKAAAKAAAQVNAILAPRRSLGVVVIVAVRAFLAAARVAVGVVVIRRSGAVRVASQSVSQSLSYSVSHSVTQSVSHSFTQPVSQSPSHSSTQSPIRSAAPCPLPVVMWPSSHAATLSRSAIHVARAPMRALGRPRAQALTLSGSYRPIDSVTQGGMRPAKPASQLTPRTVGQPSRQ